MKTFKDFILKAVSKGSELKDYITKKGTGRLQCSLIVFVCHQVSRVSCWNSVLAFQNVGETLKTVN